MPGLISLLTAGLGLRCWVLAILIGSFLAHAEEPRRIVDPEFLIGWNKEFSVRCATQVQIGAGCLRGLERAIKTLTGRAGRLVFEDTIDINSESTPPFKVGPLVFAEETKESLAHQRRMAIQDPKALLQSERKYDERFTFMALSQQISPADWNAAFEWVNSQVKTAEVARHVLAGLLSAERFEINKDPYALVRQHRVYSSTVENRPMTVEYIDGHYVVAKIRPNSKADRAGVTVGMVLESLGDQVPTPENLTPLFKAFNSDGKIKARFRGTDGRELEIPYWGKENPLPGFHQFILPMRSGPVGVIEIIGFNTEKLCVSIRDQLYKFRAANVKALIVDLRRNSGGDVEVARCVAGLLMGEDLRLVNMRSLVDDAGSYDLRSYYPKILKPMPMIMMIDSASASSAEILAGAAQDLRLAWIVGARSYGKGIAQEISPLYINGDRIEGMDQVRTIFRFEFGSGHSPQGVGIRPDLAVTSSIAGVDGERSAVRFTDRFGEVFQTLEPANLEDPVRGRRLKRLRACVAHAQLARRWRQSPDLARWLADQQLRVAALASECEIGRELRAAEISPKWP